jgi:DNA polymerase kappa
MHALKLSGSTLQDVLFATNNLRHTAVHRLPTTARGISQLIQSAVKLAEALQDPLRTAQLEELHYEIDSKIKAMELNKNVLENSVSHELQEIRRKREVLDRNEKDLIAGVLREDLQSKSLIGLLLEESVRNIFAEQGRASAELEKDRDDAEVSGDEDEINGCSLTADGVTESVELV